MEIVGIRERPEWLDAGVAFFDAAFGGGTSSALYYDCIVHSLDTDSPLPRWFLAVDGDRILGGCGLITNDFISRMDLWPWLCALFVVEEARGRGLGGRLLAHAVAEAGRLGFPAVHLSTDHTSYYERYGWSFLANGVGYDGGISRIYRIGTPE